MDKWVKEAMELGATEAGWLDTAQIRFLPEVRKMCVDGNCGGYGKNWACPPGCGPVEACAERVRGYRRGLVFTFAAQMEDPFDYEAIEMGGKRIKELALAMRDRLWDQGMERVWLMTPGPCAQCPQCQYPKPCIHPELATTSPEAQGMWVSEICKQAGVNYNSGKNTVTYVGAVFFQEPE